MNVSTASHPLHLTRPDTRACVYVPIGIHSLGMRERRQVPRYLLEIPARLFCPASGKVVDVAIPTIGVHGCSVEVVGGPDVGHKCELNLEWRGKELRVEAEVVWKTQAGQIGLKFQSLEKESRDLLRELCATLRLQPLVKLPPEPDD